MPTRSAPSKRLPTSVIINVKMPTNTPAPEKQHWIGDPRVVKYHGPEEHAAGGDEAEAPDGEAPVPLRARPARAWRRLRRSPIPRRLVRRGPARSARRLMNR